MAIGLPSSARRERRRVEESGKWYAHLLGYIQHWDHSLQVATQALQLDPLSHVINVHVINVSYVRCLVFTHHWDRASEQCCKALEFDVNSVPLQWMLANSYAGNGMHEEAIQERKWVVDHSDGVPTFVAINSFSCGRESLAPDSPMSTYSRSTEIPRAAQ